MQLWEQHDKTFNCKIERNFMDMLSCVELVLDSHGHMCPHNRLPGENEVMQLCSLTHWPATGQD